MSRVKKKTRSGSRSESVYRFVFRFRRDPDPYRTNTVSLTNTYLSGILKKRSGAGGGGGSLRASGSSAANISLFLVQSPWLVRQGKMIAEMVEKRIIL